jgi:hypothetical protein
MLSRPTTRLWQLQSKRAISTAKMPRVSVRWLKVLVWAALIWRSPNLKRHAARIIPIGLLRRSKQCVTYFTREIRFISRNISFTSISARQAVRWFGRSSAPWIGSRDRWRDRRKRTLMRSQPIQDVSRETGSVTGPIGASAAKPTVPFQYSANHLTFSKWRGS